MAGTRPDERDVAIGANMRKLREVAGLTLSDVGRLLGVSGAQVSKYESGVNRISARHLFVLSRRFDAPMEAFFDGIQP